MFRQWYIDGRQAYHMLTDEKLKSIVELRKLDVRYLEKIRVVTKKQEQGVDVVTGYNEYFVYRPGFNDAETKLKSIILIYILYSYKVFKLI